MIEGRRILAVVPARAGSKGVPNKNMRQLCGLSLIGWAGRALNQLDYLDARVISTDSSAYAAEGERQGLKAPFIRPPELSTDSATGLDTVTHALREVEKQGEGPFDIVLIIEPTSPLRLPVDITRTVMHLIRDGRDSALAVSRLEPKWHPRKALRLLDGRVTSMVDGEAIVWIRQELDNLFWRNGVCYAVTRDCLLRDRLIIGKNCAAEVIEHAVVNIDYDWEFDWADFLLHRDDSALLRAVSNGEAS